MEALVGKQNERLRRKKLATSPAEITACIWFIVTVSCDGHCSPGRVAKHDCYCKQEDNEPFNLLNNLPYCVHEEGETLEAERQNV